MSSFGEGHYLQAPMLLLQLGLCRRQAVISEFFLQQGGLLHPPLEL